MNQHHQYNHLNQWNPILRFHFFQSRLQTFQKVLFDLDEFLQYLYELPRLLECPNFFVWKYTNQVDQLTYSLSFEDPMKAPIEHH